MLRVHIDSFAYSEAEILHQINFQLNKGEHLAVLGESGCGKSTLLHLIYGLLHLEQGSLHWNGKPLLGPRFNLVPGEEFMKLVAQEFNIMPYTTVKENVATYLSRLDEKADNQRISKLLEVVALEPFAKTKVKDLSGGQKQRVALAKALAKKPQLLLLDEPFSNIDTFRKNQLRRTLFGYLKEHRIACITATHDAEEALAYSDSLLILKEGRMEALGHPEEIYHQLQNSYIAGFFGEVSELSSAEDSKFRPYLPHQLQKSHSDTTIRVKVVHAYFKGSHYLIEAESHGQRVFFNHPHALTQGELVSLEIRK